MAYRFASSNQVGFAIAPLSGKTFPPGTFACFAKRSGTATTQFIIEIADSGSVTKTGLLARNTDVLRFNVATNADGPSIGSDTTNWLLIVVTCTGTSARYHVHNGTSWSHTAGSGSLSSYTVTGTDKLTGGSDTAGNCLIGDIVCLGVKNTDSTDLQVQALSRTAWSAWTGFGFDWLIGFDASSTRTNVSSPGSGDELSRSGTTLVSDPPGWSWVTGGGGGGGGVAKNQYSNQLANGVDMRTMTYAAHASLANGVAVGGAAEGTLTTTGSPSGVLGTGSNSDLYTPAAEVV